MIKKYLIHFYTKLGENIRVFGHHGSIHFKNFFRTSASFLVLWLISIPVINTWGLHNYVVWIFTLLGICLYLYFILEFLNNYLDSLISGEHGVTIFRRDGVLQYSVQQFERESIDMISFQQHSLSDKIRNKGSIVINLNQGVSFFIEHISNPKKVTNILRSQKGQYTRPKAPILEEEPENNEKFEMLVETLGEVIKDYMQKPQAPKLDGF